ncbi:MAG: F0F1 ATP synthase subunit delta [Lachnospiraceae bacterium]|nr:F0F1 ATP synthase subunit delta [Lachnospiraceae bacterium]
MAKLVSNTYGEALFELAVEEGKEDLFLEEIGVIRGALNENPDLSKLMNHPRILKEEKLEVIKNIFKGRICDELLGFLNIIVTKDRYSEIDGILDYFISEIKALKGIGVASVKTATELSDSLKKAIEEKLLQTTGYKSMEMDYTVDPDLIGGIVIRIKDRVVDSSVQTKLNKLQHELLNVQLKSL